MMIKEKIAVHLHLYYFDMWEKIKSLLSNIEGYEYDLFVTIVEENKELIEKIKEFHSSTKIFKVENRGYDIGPFVYFLHQINLNDYDYILKLHTKNASKGVDTLINNKYISRKSWNLALFNSVLGSRQLVEKNLNLLRKNRIGMVGSKYLITNSMKNHPVVEQGVRDIMLNLGYNNISEICFVAGTMFWVKSQLLSPIRDNFKIGDFPMSDATIKDGTLAHTLERVMGCLVTANGFEIKGCDKIKELEPEPLWKIMQRFCYRKKITNNNRLLIKVFKLPIYNKKIA